MNNIQELSDLTIKTRKLLFNTEDITKVIFGIKATNGRIVKHKVIDEEFGILGSNLYITKINKQSSCFSLSELSLIKNIQAGNIQILSVNQ